MEVEWGARKNMKTKFFAIVTASKSNIAHFLDFIPNRFKK